MVILRQRVCQRCQLARFVPDEIAINHNTCRECSRKRFKRQHRTKPCHGCGSRRRRPRRSHYCERCAYDPVQANRDASKRYYDALRADPARWVEFVDGKRITTRMRNGSKPLTPEQYVERYGGADGGNGDGRTVDAAPLVRVMREWLDELDAHDLGSDALAGLNTIKRLERLSGVSDRTLGAILRGHRLRCSLLTADRVATAIGSHIDVIYSDAPGVVGSP